MVVMHVSICHINKNYFHMKVIFHFELIKIDKQVFVWHNIKRDTLKKIKRASR